MSVPGACICCTHLVAGITTLHRLSMQVCASGQAAFACPHNCFEGQCFRGQPCCDLVAHMGRPPGCRCASLRCLGAALTGRGRWLDSPAVGAHPVASCPGALTQAAQVESMYASCTPCRPLRCHVSVLLQSDNSVNLISQSPPFAARISLPHSMQVACPTEGGHVIIKNQVGHAMLFLHVKYVPQVTRRSLK